MAAELIGTTIGVVGFIGQLFDGCVKAYGYFTTASQLDTDSQRLMCKVRIEEMRLVVWGREWGVAEGKLEAHLEGGKNQGLRELATQILEELHETVTDFRKLQERYGLREESGNGNGNGGKKNSPVSTPAVSRKGSKDESKVEEKVLKTERSWRKEWSLRTKWVIAGIFFSFLSCWFWDRFQREGMRLLMFFCDRQGKVYEFVKGLER